MKVIIEKGLQGEIFKHLEASHPNEGGGFLLGTINGDTVHISETISVQNVFEEEEQYHRYAMTPQDWMKLEDEADERGIVAHITATRTHLQSCRSMTAIMPCRIYLSDYAGERGESC
jgi:proteasome lid subunit RPN8/RPN11